MSTRAEYREEREGVSVHVRPTKKRAAPFLASLMVAFLVLPALYGISHLFMIWDRPTGVMIADAWLISGCVIAMVAVGVGLFKARRISFVIKHVATTLFLVGLGGNLYTFLGFGYRLLNVVAVFTTAILWGSWMLYRIDAFRAAAKGESADGWADVIGLARSRPKKVTTTDTHVIVDVEHGPGETTEQVAAGAKKLADAAGAVVGRTTVTQPDGRGGSSQIRMLMADPFATGWRPFPGPSHPGRSFAYPFRTAYYEDGVDQWFSFVRGVVTSPFTTFRAPQATFVGLQGSTGSGKSGELNNAACETLTRNDAVLVWLDTSKFRQNVGWCADMLAFGACDKAADRPDGATPRKVALALRRIAEHRVEVFGQVSLDAMFADDEDMEKGREWTPELALETGEPAIHVIADEADEYIMTKEWEWLGARGRSLGIFLHVSLPRASTAEITAKLRSSLATWKTFAIGDKYSHDFSLSKVAEEAGADPTMLREPGLHYLDSAPGIPQERWPVLCRTFQSERRTLRNMVLQARQTFTPMPLSPGSIEAMGELYEQITPDVLLGLRRSAPKDEDGPDPEAVEAAAESAAEAQPEPAAGPPRRAARKPAPARPESRPEPDDDGDMEETQRIKNEVRDEPGKGYETEGGHEVQAIAKTPEGSVLPDGEGGIGEVSTLTHPGLDDEAGIDPRNPNDPDSGYDVELEHDKPPAPNPEQAEQAFNAALLRLYRAGKTTITNQDVHTEMEYAWTDPTMSRRLAAVEAGTRILPDGLTLERLGFGRFQIHKTGPSPRPRGSQSKGS
jgi:hypothetical protein